MFAEPPVPHSLGYINITISSPEVQRISYPRVAYRAPLPEVITPTSLRLTRDIIGTAPSTQVNSTITTRLPLSPNRTPVEVEKLVHTPDHTQIYQRYFHESNLKVKSLTFSQSAPVDVVPSSPPQVISQTLVEDPFTGPPAPSRLPEKDQVLLLPEQDLKIEVPRRDLGQPEIHILLQMTAKLVSESLDTTMKKKESDLLRTGYRKGLAAAAVICNSPSYSPTDNNPVKSQPGIPELITETLANVERSAQPEYDPPLDLPRFTDTAKYVRSLRGTSRRRVLGKMDGVDVFVSVIGGVETHDYDREDDEFFGKCIVRIEDHEIKGYCLGSIGTSGTGIIICQDESLIAYSPPNAVDNEWPPMEGVIGAIIMINQNGDISLEHMADVEVESLAEW